MAEGKRQVLVLQKSESLKLFQRGTELRSQKRHEEAEAVLLMFEGGCLDDAPLWYELATLCWWHNRPKGCAYLKRLVSQRKQTGVARYVKQQALGICSMLSYYGCHPWQSSLGWLEGKEELYVGNVVAILTKRDGPTWDESAPPTEQAAAATFALAQQLVKLGHRVVIYGNPSGDAESLWPDTNPSILPWSHFERDIGNAGAREMKALISWTDCKEAHLGRAKKRILWVTDASIPRMDRFEAVVCQSAWQRLRLGKDEGKKCRLIPHPCVPEAPAIEQKISPPGQYACVYSGSYVNGLEPLLMMWPSIKERWPAAKLDIYGGDLPTPGHHSSWNEEIAQLIRQMPDVTERSGSCTWGRYRWWLHPATVWESFSETAIQARSSGCIPVVNSLGSLKELIPHGFTCDELKDYMELLRKAFSTSDQQLQQLQQQIIQLPNDAYKLTAVIDQWRQLLDESA